MFDEKTELEMDRIEDMTIAEIIEEYDDSDPVAEALAERVCAMFVGPWRDDDHEQACWKALFDYQATLWPLGHLMNRLSRADRWMLNKWVAETAQRTLREREWDRRAAAAFLRAGRNRELGQPRAGEARRASEPRASTRQEGGRGMTQTTVDPLQGIKDERQSAWENAERLFKTWATVDPDEALSVLVAWIEAARACSALDLELIQLESRHGTH